MAINLNKELGLLWDPNHSSIIAFQDVCFTSVASSGCSKDYDLKLRSTSEAYYCNLWLLLLYTRCIRHSHIQLLCTTSYPIPIHKHIVTQVQGPDLLFPLDIPASKQPGNHQCEAPVKDRMEGPLYLTCTILVIEQAHKTYLGKVMKNTKGWWDPAGQS